MSNSQQIQQYFNQAVKLMQQNDFQAALNILESLEKAGLKDFRLYRLIGIAYERIHRNKLACDYFLLSLAGNPSQHDLFSALARLYSLLQAYSEARKWHLKAVAAVPGIETYSKYADFLLSTAINEPDEALSWLNKLDLPQRNEQIILLEARAHGLKGDLKEQEALLLKAGQNFTSSKAVLLALAWFYKESGESEKAHELFSAATRHSESTDTDWENLAMYYLSRQQVDKANLSVKEGLTHFEDSRVLLKLMASLRYEMGDADFLSGYKSKPLEDLVLPVALDYVDKCVVSERHDEAMDAITKLIKKHGNNASVHQRLAVLQYENKQYEQAIRIFKALSEHTPENKNHFEWVAKSMLANGQYHDAQSYITQLLETSPSNQLYWGLQATQWRLTKDERYYWLCNYDQLVKPVTLVTPQGYKSTDDFLEDLKSTLISMHATEQRPLDQTLRIGTQTTGDLLKNEEPILQILRGALYRTANEALSTLPSDSTHPTLSYAGRKFDFTASWSVRLRDQGFHVSHVHPKGWYSSAFYVELPGTMSATDKAGWLHLGKPGIALSEEVEADHWIRPEPGKLALFPSFVWHGTEPFRASQHRLTVAFDLGPQ